MGSDGKQYAQLSNGTYYAITDNSNEVVDEQVETFIKQDEVDLGIDNDMDMINSPTPALGESDFSTIASELRKINDRLDVYDGKLSKLTTEVGKINDRLDVQEGLLVKVTEFMANFNKLLSMKNSNNVTLTPTRQEEDFSEYENMAKIDSDQSFKAFDQSLADPAYSGKFFRYLHSIYSLNGKRDSGPLFRTLIRRLITPNVLIPYSWMGNKRTKKGSTGDSGQNINFQETFPNFIKLMHQVFLAADCSNTREQNEKLFKNLLRYKNLELKRYENGSGEHRASSSRKRHKRQKTEVHAVSEQTIEHANIVEPSQTPTHKHQQTEVHAVSVQTIEHVNVVEPSQTSTPSLHTSNSSQSSEFDNEDESENSSIPSSGNDEGDILLDEGLMDG